MSKKIKRTKSKLSRQLLNFLLPYQKKEGTVNQMYTKMLNIILQNVSKEKRENWKALLHQNGVNFKMFVVKQDEDFNFQYKAEEDYLFIGEDKWINSARQVLPEKCVFVVNKIASLPMETPVKDIFAVWFSDSEKNYTFQDHTNFMSVLNYIIKRDENSIKELWLETILNTLPDLIWFKDMKGIHLDVNPAFCEMVHKSREEVAGKTHQEIWESNDHCQESCICLQTEEEVIASEKTAIYYEDIVAPDGKELKLKTWKAPVFKDGVMIGTVGIARDITKEFEYTKNIEQLAHYDQLTGLGNRNKLKKYLSTVKTLKMVIVYMDMDNFKSINDTYGHLIGDNAIKMLANQIKAQFPDALNVRLGGDEFISVFIDNVDMKQIASRVSTFVSNFKALCQEIPMFDKLSVSAGIAEGQLGHGSFEKLLQKADKALYLAKEKCKGNFWIIKDGTKPVNAEPEADGE